MSKYIIENTSGYCLSNQYDKAGEMVLGYGGVWCEDRRKAKKFKFKYQAEYEIKKMQYVGTGYGAFITKRR